MVWNANINFATLQIDIITWSIFRKMLKHLFLIGLDIEKDFQVN